MITVSIDNADMQRFIKDVHKYSADTQKKISDQIHTTAWNIDRKAKSDCPVRTGGLRGSIKPLFGGTLTAKVGTNMHYAPYVEFGTGTSVKVPSGLEDYARQFKGRGIRKVNLRARPFLFPAAESERKDYESNILKILGKQ